MKDILELILVVVLVVGTLIGAASLYHYYFGPKQCENYGKITEKHTEWDYFSGCFIEYEGEMVSWDEYKYRFVARETVE